jgi:hypothetical protein
MRKATWKIGCEKHLTFIVQDMMGLVKYYNQWMYRVRNRFFQKIIKRTCQGFNNSNALDIGYGTGFTQKNGKI